MKFYFISEWQQHSGYGARKKTTFCMRTDFEHLTQSAINAIVLNWTGAGGCEQNTTIQYNGAHGCDLIVYRFCYIKGSAVVLVGGVVVRTAIWCGLKCIYKKVMSLITLYRWNLKNRRSFSIKIKGSVGIKEILWVIIRACRVSFCRFI